MSGIALALAIDLRFVPVQIPHARGERVHQFRITKQVFKALDLVGWNWFKCSKLCTGPAEKHLAQFLKRVAHMLGITGIRSSVGDITDYG